MNDPFVIGMIILGLVGLIIFYSIKIFRMPTPVPFEPAWPPELDKIRERLDFYEARFAALCDEHKIMVEEFQKAILDLENNNDGHNKRIRNLEKRDGEVRNWVELTIESLELQQSQIEHVQNQSYQAEPRKQDNE